MSDIIDIAAPVATLAPGRVGAYLELTKPRISAMVLVATSLGFYLALSSAPDWASAGVLLHALIGVALVGGGANALNQYLEMPQDARMVRTQGRPLPSGRLSPTEALLFGVSAGVTGVICLALLVNVLAAVVAAATLVLYVGVYTPAKRVTSLCVLIGAVPGALPPVIGWAAGGGSLALHAWLLFALVFVWQLPHFATIAWLYRDDYARAGYPMLPVIDPVGIRTDLHLITHSIMLITVSTLPVVYGMAGSWYLCCAIVSGTAFLAFGIVFVVRKTPTCARMHVIASVSHLLLLCVIMVLDKTYP